MNLARSLDSLLATLARSRRALQHVGHRWVLRTPHLHADIPEHRLRLKIATSDVIGRHLYKYRRYEPEIAGILARHVRFAPGDVMLDIGANIGWYSLLVHRLSGGQCRILAFEPDPDNFELLCTNLGANDALSTVEPINAAASESAGTLQLTRYPSGNNGRHSLLALHEGESVPVRTVRLDDFWREHGLGEAPVRLLKMDIEGYELIALRGAAEVLQRCEWVLVEHSPEYMRLAGLDPAALVALLADAGLEPWLVAADDELVAISPDTLAGRAEQTNVFWRRRAA